MERSVVNFIISIVLLASVVGSKATTRVYLTENATAYWTNYYTKRIHWDLEKAGVACASIDADKPFEWRNKYNWTAFCGLSGPSYPSSCGLCLKVTNPTNEASVVVRIVDQCGSESMELDEPAFSEIDDGSGKTKGHLTVNYRFVDCDPPPPPPPAGPGPELKDICGKCLKVTKRRTKDEEIVRIVDSCGSDALELDLTTAFTPIDSDGKGYAAGHLVVDYQVVDCDDDDDVDSQLRLYSQ
ncbi:hypothetical protein V6N12_046054 [Hibiscus sabdariffa]|uniref:Barwin domain-containing protein n=1 Tax=Hibiscus sabdariffa TaxID=183260 RepID=A0ABR2G4M9_9ROSI